MNLLADESVDWPIVARLRQDGHDVAYVAELAPSLGDDEVLDRANTSGAVLLTSDKDFGELVYRLRRINAGVVLIRLGGLAPRTKADLVSQACRTHASQLLNAFSVVSPGVVRIRCLPMADEHDQV